MARTSEKSEYFKALGRRLEEKFLSSRYKSHAQLARRASELGFPVSSDVIGKYFRGETEPGAFILTGLCLALSSDANEILAGTKKPFTEDQKTHVDDLSKSLQKALEDSDIHTYEEIFARMDGLGYTTSLEDIRSIMEGRKIPSSFELAGIAKSLRISMDKLIFGVDPRDEARDMLEQTTQKLIEAAKYFHSDEAKAAERLVRLFNEAPDRIKTAVLEILENSVDK